MSYTKRKTEFAKKQDPEEIFGLSEVFVSSIAELTESSHCCDLMFFQPLVSKSRQRF